MTTRWAEIENGARRNIVVFVDDWKGTSPRTSIAPVSYVGRAYRQNPAFEELAAILETAQSNAWHVSKHGAGSLFISPHFDDIMAALERSASILYTQIWIKDQYSRSEVKNFVASLAPAVCAGWRVSNTHGLALLEFVLRLRWYMANTELTTKHERLSVLVVVDNVDWLKPSKQPLRKLHPLPTSSNDRLSRVSVETVIVAGKRQQSMLPYARFLGLVDSEVWAFGRFLSTVLADGTTVHERLVAWQQTGLNHNLQPEDTERSLRSGTGRSSDYQERAIWWPSTGQSVSLTTAHDPHSVVGPLARQFALLAQRKRGLTDAETAEIFRTTLEQFASQLFCPQTEGSWLDL